MTPASKWGDINTCFLCEWSTITIEHPSGADIEEKEKYKHIFTHRYKFKSKQGLQDMFTTFWNACSQVMAKAKATIFYKTKRRKNVYISTKKEKSSSKQFICAAWIQITHTLACLVECQKCSFQLYISDSLILLRNHFWSISWKSHLNLFYLASREKDPMFAFLLLKTVPILLTDIQLVKFGQ